MSRIVITDNLGNPIEVDDATMALVTIPIEHHEVHEGEAFTCSASTSKDTDGTIKVTILTGSTMYAHMTINITGSGATTVVLYEGATATGGSAQTAYNRNRTSSNTSTLTITLDPTVSVNGTALITNTFGSGDKKTQLGGDARGEHEWLLNLSTKYYILITSNADGNVITWDLEWYEEDI